jgi:hypothetical protein
MSNKDRVDPKLEAYVQGLMHCVRERLSSKEMKEYFLKIYSDNGWVVCGGYCYASVDTKEFTNIPRPCFFANQKKNK